MFGGLRYAVFVFGGLAEPAGDDIVLSWSAPSQCPTTGEVVARVRARVAQRPSARIEADAIVDRSVAEPGAWRLRLRVHGDETVAVREIEAQTCDALADAAATMLAVAATSAAEAPREPVEIPPPVTTSEVPRTEGVAPSTVVEPSVAPSTVVEPGIASTAEPRRPAPPSETTPRLPRPRARLAVLGGVDHGALPGTGGSLLGELGLGWDHLRVTAFGLYAFGRRVSSRDVAARHRVAAGGVSICGVALVRAFELGGCVKGELGALLSEGTRGEALQADRSWWGAASLGGFAGWRFASRWSLVLGVDAVVPGVRRRFFVGEDLVGRIGPVGVRALGGIAVVLP